MSFRVEGLISRTGQRFDFEVPHGGCLGVRGPSGSGKTVLLRMLADLEPAPGLVTLDGVSRESMPAHVWRRRVTWVPAEPRFWEDTIVAHVSEPLRPAFIDLLRDSLGLGERVDAPVSVLSSGEAQRVCLARAVVQKPQVLLLDEPTSALDQVSASKVEALIGGLISAGTIVVLVSHRLDQLERLSTLSLSVAGS